MMKKHELTKLNEKANKPFQTTSDHFKPCQTK
jgi:hypothetical protein